MFIASISYKYVAVEFQPKSSNNDEDQEIPEGEVGSTAWLLNEGSMILWPSEESTTVPVFQKLLRTHAKPNSVEGIQWICYECRVIGQPQGK
jgi:hypothetical protein